MSNYYRAVEKQKRIRCFIDGIDWQHHLEADMRGTLLFPTLEDCKRGKECLAAGGRCGVVEVEVRLIDWVEEQDLMAEAAQTSAKDPLKGA